MEEYINEIREYLPISYQDKDNNDYIDYLINAFIKTSETENYQFSFLAFHLLYMSFIYKVIRQSYDQDMRNIRNHISQLEREITGYENPFDLSVIAENKSINLLRCFGFHRNKIAEFQSIITHRNNVAHASGFVQYNEEKVRRLIEEELKNIEEIQHRGIDVVSGMFENYFEKNFDLNDNSNFFPSGLDSVDRFSEAQLLSIKDLETLILNAPAFLDDDSDNLTIIYKKVFFILLAGKLDEWKDNETNYFLDLLPKLLTGFDKQDATDINDLFDTVFQDILFELDYDSLNNLQAIFTDYNVNYDLSHFIELSGGGGVVTPL